MLYRIVRPLANLTLKTNFRKIYFSNVELIPDDHPVILAVNHPTAFIEPCVLACFQPHSLHFLVRGDFFAKPLFRYLLERLHMIPIYRLKDGGFTKLKNNYSTFERCYIALRAQKTLMILAEGSCIHEKRLRPIRKGTARIAFGAFEKYQIEDLRIVPIGVNYAAAEAFRSDLMIEVGEPIRLEDYLDQYREEPQAAIRQLTEDVGKRLAEKVIIIERPEDEALVENLFTLFRNTRPFQVWPILERDAQRLHGEKRLADWVNQMAESEKEQWKQQVDTYFQKLEHAGLTDFGLMQDQHYSYRNSLLLVLGALPFALGSLGNAPPIVLTNFIGDYFVKTVEFRQSVKVSVGLGIYLLYLLLLLTLSWHWNSNFLLLIVFLLPFLGYFALLYWELGRRWQQGRQIYKAEKEKVTAWKALREKLLQQMPG